MHHETAVMCVWMQLTHSHTFPCLFQVSSPLPRHVPPLFFGLSCRLFVLSYPPCPWSAALWCVRMAELWRCVKGSWFLIGANSSGHLPGLSPLCSCSPLASLTNQLKDTLPLVHLAKNQDETIASNCSSLHTAAVRESDSFFILLLLLFFSTNMMLFIILYLTSG